MNGSKRSWVGWVAGFAVALATFPNLIAEPASTRRFAPETMPERPRVVRIYYDELEQIRALADFDVWEFNDREQRYVLALLDAEDLAQVRTLGFRAEIDAGLTEEIERPRPVDPAQTSGVPGFPCYRTVEETYATAEQIVASYPNLATWTDIGNSWEKTAGVGSGGYDLFVLRLTNGAVPGPKPKMIATCGIHAREYTTAELCTRFAEALVAGHGVDADTTWLLDHNEVHLVLQTNPDGRKRAEGGELWRKNTNQAYCGASSPSRGADLNRNLEFQWGCCGGSSGSPCSETYRGASAASEPEVQAVQSYLLAEFPDQRGAPLDAAAPDDATGVYLDIHSYSELVLWPWGFGGSAPNEVDLRTLGRKLAFFNGYTPQQAIDLYPTDGTTIDFAYGNQGVAAFVFELGTAFFQSCAAFEGSILPDNLEALFYALKSAREPYRTPAGPDALGVTVSPALAEAGTHLTVAATLDDTRFEQSNGAEPVQAIAEAEFWVDEPPWGNAADRMTAPTGRLERSQRIGDLWDPVTTATAQPMEADDGVYDATIEAASGTLDTTGLTGGRHILFVRGRDAEGNWGPISAKFFHIVNGAEGAVAGVVTETESGLPLAATVSVDALGIEVATNAVTGAYSIELPAGPWHLAARAPLHLTGQADVTVVTGSTTIQDFSLAPTPPILLVDDDDNGPDVRSSYTAALDALGETYSVWDTGNSDEEPSVLDLAPYETVVWFTGDEYGGAAGPGSAGEVALASWLDGGRCLWIAAQDYFWDRGLTSFMQSRLGLASGTSDVSQTTVTGQGAAFGGLGPFALSFPYSNFTDRLTSAASGTVAFEGNQGSAAVAQDTGYYRTTFWSFGLETLPTAGDRQDVAAAFLDWCAQLAATDADSDGAPNAEDCAPLDPGLWSEPGPALGLAIAAQEADNLTWSAPSSPGASSLVYDVLRSRAVDDFSGADCLASATTVTTATDGELPLSDELFVYLVRSRNPCGASLGAGSDGSPRSGPVCP